MEKIYKTPMLYGTVCYMAKKCAVCYIDPKGKTHLVSKKTKLTPIKHNYFFVRGIEYFVFGLICFFSNLVQTEFYATNINKKISNSLNVTTKQITAFVLAIISIFVGFFLLGFLPVKISVALSGINYSITIKKVLVALCKIIIIYFSLMSFKLFAAFKQFYRFNASLNISQNNNNKIHKPTNFLNFLVFGFLVNIFVVSLLGFTANSIIKIFVNIAVLLCVFGLCYEILYASEKFGFYSWCIITSWLVTETPTTTEKYCTECAMCEVTLMQNKNREISTKGEHLDFAVVYSEAKQKLQSVDVFDKADLDWLFCEVLECSRSQLRLKTQITKSQYKQINSAISKRQKGCPITKIFGRTEFYGLEFKVTKDVLSPRMETELLVEDILKNINEKTEVLDIGTGSGVIAICLAKFSNAKITAVDISDKALEVAEYNAKQNNVNVTFKNSNLFENLKKNKKFDIIVSNPPYIKSEDIQTLDKEVKNYDPILALDGGKSGLEFYEKIILQAPLFLSKNGQIFFEVGKGQASDVSKLLEKDFEDIQIIKDYNKINRIVKAKLKNKREQK